ncbi:MAG: succinylglutamate-semialdehyde dehydrogenase [Tepidisphaeraceae bacterium]
MDAMSASGESFHSTNPATGESVWQGRAAGNDDVDRAVATARAAADSWAAQPIAARTRVLLRFADQLKTHSDELTDTICRETGKPRWESRAEVDAMASKIKLSIESHQQRRSPTETESAGTQSATRYKPHGVLAVLGPFNFPGHLPNGHIVPALLAGNSVVFKPSELAPLVAEKTHAMWIAAGLPGGALQLVQGGRATGEALVRHPDIDGVLFTGSFTVGRAINRVLAEHPGRIAALEMGGNNALVVHHVRDMDAAAYWTIQSAFITAGQRCSCARRLILTEDSWANDFVDHLVAMTRRIVVGAYTQSPEPFMGPVISDSAAQKLMDVQRELQAHAAGSLVEMSQAGARKGMLSPGIIDVTGVKQLADEEHFGPLLQVIRVKDFDAAIDETNRTSFGLTAGLFSDDRALYDRFYARVRAGVINFNRPLTGASSALPFGGIGDSGNHRPSAYFAADYCSYPVASMEAERLTLPEKRTPGIG